MGDPARSLEDFFEQMREEGKEPIAHPYMYISGLHNLSSCCPVDQTDPFFAEHGIKFAVLTPEEDPADAPEPVIKYVAKIEGTGAYKFVISPV